MAPTGAKGHVRRTFAGRRYAAEEAQVGRDRPEVTAGQRIVVARPSRGGGDISKNVYQLHGIEWGGKIVLRKALRCS